MPTSASWLCTLAVLWFLGPQAAAVPIHPGETVVLGGTTVAERPELGGELVAEHESAFELRGDDGALRAAGSIEVTLRMYGQTSRLLQLYRITELRDLDGSGFHIDALAQQNYVFELFGADMDYLLDSPGDIGPSRASIVEGSHWHVFHFDTPLTAGNSSRTMFKLTSDDMYDFGENAGWLQLGNRLGESFELRFDSWYTLIPEPASSGLLGLGLLLGLALRTLNPTAKTRSSRSSCPAPPAGAP